MDNNDNLISIFIGYDSRERAATNVLIDSIYQNSTVPVSITPLVKAQLESQNLFYRQRDKNQRLYVSSGKRRSTEEVFIRPISR